MAKVPAKIPTDPVVAAFLETAASLREIANDLEQQLETLPQSMSEAKGDAGRAAEVKRIKSWLNEAAKLYNATVTVVTKTIPAKEFAGVHLPRLPDRLWNPRGRSFMPEIMQSQHQDEYGLEALMVVPESPMRLGNLPTHVADAGGSEDAVVAAFGPKKENWSQVLEGVQRAIDWKRARTAELCTWLRSSANTIELAVLPRFEVRQKRGNKFEVIVTTATGKTPRSVNYKPLEWVWKLWRKAELSYRYGKKLKHQLGRELPEICPFIQPVTMKRRSGQERYKAKPYSLDAKIKSRLTFLPSVEKVLAENQQKEPQLPSNAEK